ncbi:MAG: sugar ABC transporter permease, partial [Devosia nanyangense]|nr:sugar ABC transporter permease [Devosia nanyangense]
MARAEERAAWLFLAPSLVLFLAFTVVPVISAFIISFTEWNLFNAVNFVGFGNYVGLADRTA